MRAGYTVEQEHVLKLQVQCVQEYHSKNPISTKIVEHLFSKCISSVDSSYYHLLVLFKSAYCSLICWVRVHATIHNTRIISYHSNPNFAQSWRNTTAFLSQLRLPTSLNHPPSWATSSPPNPSTPSPSAPASPPRNPSSPPHSSSYSNTYPPKSASTSPWRVACPR